MKKWISCIAGIIISLNSFSQVKSVAIPLPILDSVWTDLIKFDQLKVIDAKKDKMITTYKHTDSLNNVVILSLNKKVTTYQIDSVDHRKEIEVKDRHITEIKKGAFKTLLWAIPAAAGIGYLIGRRDD